MAAGLSCLAYARSNRARFVAELGEFVRFASVSAQPEQAHDVRNCASWLAAHLRQVGFERAQVVWTRGCLIVIRDWLRVPGRPTVLVYGYYNVQPVGPIGEWQSPPFELVVRGDKLFGRGAKFHLPNFSKGIASTHSLIGLAGIGLGTLQGHRDAPFPLGTLMTR